MSDVMRDHGYLLANHALLLQLVRGLHGRHKMMAKIIQKEAATLTFAVAVNLLSMDMMQEYSSEHSLSNSALFANYSSTPFGSNGGQGQNGSPDTPSLN